MGPLPAVPGCVKVQLGWTSPGAPEATVNLHMAYGGSAPVSADLNAYAGDIVTAAAADLAPLWTSDLALNRVEIFDLSSASGAVGAQAPNLAGGRTPAGDPASMCMVANYLINRRYRGGKPRSYWPFGEGAELASRVAWTSAFTTLCASSLTTFFTAISGKTHGSTTFNAHVNVSYFQGFTSVVDPITHRSRDVPTKRATPVVDPIVGLTCTTRPGTQRRRL
jgi:hypothetical protein